MTAVPLRVAAVAALAALACTSETTEVVIVADTDYGVPFEMDSFAMSVVGPDGITQSATATLSSSANLPRTLGVVRENGSLGPFVATLEGRLGGGTIATRVARFTLVEGEIRGLALTLLRSCAGSVCGIDQTCAEPGCRPIDIAESELFVWDTTPPHRDGGPDTCIPSATESCNFVDDDCDGMTDEGFDFQTDPMNCGSCGRVCVFSNGTGSCTAGDCLVSSCNSGFDNCDLNGANGCETELGISPTHCGACGNTCRPPDRVCCAATCARDC